MKYISQSILTIFFLTCTLSQGICQNSRPGFLLTVEGDTVTGFIRTVNWVNDPNRINHFVVAGQDGSEKTWEAKEISKYAVGKTPNIALQNGPYFYAKVWPHNGLRIFLEPRVSGSAQLFVVPDPEQIRNLKKDANRMVFDSGYEDAKRDAFYVSSLNTELAIRVKKENYELILKQVLKDCPELTEKIGKKKFRFNNLERIITFYNESCE